MKIYLRKWGKQFLLLSEKGEKAARGFKGEKLLIRKLLLERNTNGEVREL